MDWVIYMQGFKFNFAFTIVMALIPKVIVLLCLGLSSTYAKSLDSHQDLFEAKLITENLLKRYPPEQFHFLAIGRSPTLIMAYASTVQDFYMSQLPLSDFTEFSETRQSLAGFKVSPMPPKNLKLLHEHFDLFIPSQKELAGRKLLVLDYAITGVSLMSAYEYINDYLKERGRPALSGGVALSSDFSERARLKETLRKEKFSFLKTISVKPYSGLNVALETSVYDRYSPYGRYEVGQMPSKVFNSEFFSLLQEFELLETKANTFRRSVKSCNLFLSLPN